MSLRDTRKADNEEAKRRGFLKKIENDWEEYGKHAMKKVKSKNIMIIGRTRSGKSTIKSLLQDPTKVPDQLTLKSDTRDPLIESFHIEDIDATLNIIDTPGLFERGSEQSGIRDNEAILKIIEKCANMEITSFNVICFCVAITAGINGDDVKSIELFMKFLGDEISGNSCLIITHCEAKNEEQRNMITKELGEDKFFKQIAPFFKLGVLFSGSISRDNYNNGNECIIDEYVAVSEYRTQLIKLFTSDIKPFPITETQISEIRRANEAKTSIENEFQKAQNLCKEQEATNKQLLTTRYEQKHLIEDLQRKCTEKDHTIDNIQKKCVEKERSIQDSQKLCEEHRRTIDDLQKMCKELRRTIDDLQRKCTEGRSYISNLQSEAKEDDCIIQYLLNSSNQRTIDELRRMYPNYFSKKNFAISPMNNNYHRC